MALISPYLCNIEVILLVYITSMALISPYSCNLKVILLINIISMVLVSVESVTNLRQDIGSKIKVGIQKLKKLGMKYMLIPV